MVVREGADQHRQHQRAHQPRHQKQAARARIHEAALLKQLAVFLSHDLAAERCVEPANPGVRKALQQPFETLGLDVSQSRFRGALSAVRATRSRRGRERRGLQRAFVERVS